MSMMPSAVSGSPQPSAATATIGARSSARPLRDLASMLAVGLLAIPYALVLGGVFLLGRWDALRQRLGRG